MSDLDNRRVKKERDIICWLNDTGRYYGGVFDCGELGFFRIYWRGSVWEYHWIDVEKDPTE